MPRSLPEVVDRVMPVHDSQPDDLLLLAASYEDRCLGLARHTGGYAARQVLITVYDGCSPKREENIGQLKGILSVVGDVTEVPASHSDPTSHVSEVVKRIRGLALGRTPRISLDVSTFTKKHLLMLFQGLDLAGLLRQCNLYYTAPKDFHTYGNQPLSEGISSVGMVTTFAGANYPSKDTLLIMFLGYEGDRALSIWEHLEPNETVAVIPDPPYFPGWKGRTEVQNRYLLSMLSADAVQSSHSLLPASTEDLLGTIIDSERYPANRYNYLIAPVGTKAQTVGIYRFWRLHQGFGTVVYASPARHKEEEATYPAGTTWLVDRTDLWPAGEAP